MNNDNLSARIVAKMMDNDFFSQWLGVNVDAVSPGFCRISLTVRKEMLNGFGISHGGIAFSIADSALAFASNSRNKKSVVINTSVSFTSAVNEGDVLVAEATETNLSNRIGIYNVMVRGNNDKNVLVFTGTVFRKDDLWFPDAE